MSGELGLGFQVRRVLGAEEAVEVGIEAEVGADLAAVVAAFVGEDGDLHAAGVLGTDELERAGHERHVLEEDLFGVGDVFLRGLGDEGLGEEVAHGIFQAAADGAADLLHRGRGKAVLREDVSVAALDGDEGVDDGAVEIEEEGGEAGHR